MAAEYYRPNLTSEQRDLLLPMVEGAIDQTTGVNDPAFDPLYRLLLKLRDCRRISTETRPSTKNVSSCAVVLTDA